MEFTENEIKIIRRALLDYAIKVIFRMIEKEKEEEALGLDNFYSQLDKEYHDDIKNIITKIDSEWPDNLPLIVPPLPLQY